MNRFTFGLGYKEFNIDVENYKFLVGNDIKTKYDIYTIIRSVFNKTPNSEYAIEENNKHQLKFNDRPIELRNWKIIEITPFFDLETDMKMGSKSLMNKYLESFGDFLEQNEIYNTLSILINSLNEEFFDTNTKISFGDKKVKLQLGEISKNTFAKEIFPTIVSNNFECNSADMDYEDIILFQLAIVEKILNNGINYNVLIYCNIPYLTKKIELAIYRLKYSNAYLFVDTPIPPNIDLTDICIVGKHFIDLANQEDVLDKIMDFPFHIEREDLLIQVKNYINGDDKLKIEPLIIELFG